MIQREWIQLTTMQATLTQTAEVLKFYWFARRVFVHLVRALLEAHKSVE